MTVMIALLLMITTLAKMTVVYVMVAMLIKIVTATVSVML